MLNWAFANFESIMPKDEAAGMAPIPVLHGKKQQVRVSGRIGQPVTVKKGTEAELKYRVTVSKNISAPAERGQTVGKVEILYRGKVISQYPICCAEGVEKMNFTSAFLLFLREIFHIS